MAFPRFHITAVPVPFQAPVHSLTQHLHLPAVLGTVAGVAFATTGMLVNTAYFPANAAATALNGAVFEMIAHGVITGALFMLVGVIYERRHTRMISEYGGLSKVMPVYATVFMVMTMSSSPKWKCAASLLIDSVVFFVKSTTLCVRSAPTNSPAILRVWS